MTQPSIRPVTGGVIVDCAPVTDGAQARAIADAGNRVALTVLPARHCFPADVSLGPDEAGALALVLLEGHAPGRVDRLRAACLAVTAQRNTRAGMVRYADIDALTDAVYELLPPELPPVLASAGEENR